MFTLVRSTLNRLSNTRIRTPFAPSIVSSTLAQSFDSVIRQGREPVGKNDLTPLIQCLHLSHQSLLLRMNKSQQIIESPLSSTWLILEV